MEKPKIEHTRILHDPYRRTIELVYHGPEDGEFQKGRRISQISEVALTNLLLCYEDHWRGSQKDWWDKLIRAMKLMGELSETKD